MKIVSVSENQKIEKRIAVTPDIAKKYISLGFEVLLSEKYGNHLGIKDEEYSNVGVKFSSDEKEIWHHFRNFICRNGVCPYSCRAQKRYDSSSFFYWGFCTN